MYATRGRKVKTNKRDARAQAESCRLDAYPPLTGPPTASVTSGLSWPREATVRTHTRYISQISTLARRDGLRIRSGYAPTFLKRLARVELSAELHEEVTPPPCRWTA